MSIDDLIASKIVGIGVNEATEFNRTIFLEELENIFNKDLMEYINTNIKKIIEAIKSDERVADLDYDDKEKAFDMVFYWGYCLDSEEKEIQEYAEKKLNIELEFEEIRDLGTKLSNWNTEVVERDNYIEEIINEVIENREEYYGR